MTEKADLFMEELLQQENIRASSEHPTLNRNTSGTTAPVAVQKGIPNQSNYLYQPSGTTQNVFSNNPQPVLNTQPPTLNTVPQPQRIIAPTPSSQTQINPLPPTQGQFLSTAPVTTTQYVGVPPIATRNLPPQINPNIPVAGLQTQPNRFIAAGSFATQPQFASTTPVVTTQQPFIVNNPNLNPGVPVTQTATSNTNIPQSRTNIPTTVVSTSQVNSGTAIPSTQHIVGANPPIIGAPLPRTVTQITQSRLNGEPPAYHNVIASSQVTPVLPVVPGHPNETSQQVVGSFNATSKIEYVPFNRKIIEYEQKQTVQKVPKQKKVTEYREEVVFDMVPREAVKQDYYAVQYIKQYVAEYVPEKRVNMVRRAVPFKRIQYVPVTRQVYHGAPLGEEGSQHIPFCCDGTLDKLNMINQGRSLPWQNSGQIHGTSLYQGHNYFGGYPGGYLSAGCCDQFKRKFNNLYDNYQPYIPSFNY